MNPDPGKSNTYKEAGVDIDLAHKLLDRVKPEIKKARRPEMLAPVGGFGGLFELDLSKYKNPVLVSSIDSVGTKVIVGLLAGKFDCLGYDIVNHCINDIAVQGAEPLYFLDYLGIGKLRSPLYEQLLTGLAGACSKAGCALLGGETAEMPGMYQDDFDLVGAIVGVVEKDRIIDGENIRPGHRVLALPSNGLHTNGYSLARKVLFERARYRVDTELTELGGSIGDALLQPHTCYWPAIKAVFDAGLSLDGIAHITGGGLYDNVPRILPETVDARIDVSRIEPPAIFRLICEEGSIPKTEAYRVFNMGFGMLWFMPENQIEKAVAVCAENGIEAVEAGEAVEGSGKVHLK